MYKREDGLSMDLKEYIQSYYGNNPNWFIEETTTYDSKLAEIHNNHDYLNGQHSVLNREGSYYGDKYYAPDNTIVQLGKKIIEFHTAFMLSKPVTFSGDEDVVREMKKVYRIGQFAEHDFDILYNVLAYGRVAEYLYFDNKQNIKVKLLDPLSGKPIYNDFNELIGYIDYWTVDGISHWIIYYPDKVEHWTNNGGKIVLVSSEKNISGLPTVFQTKDGKSDLEDYKGLIDKLEKLESKFIESAYRFHDPIAKYRGRMLKNDKINPNLVGQGIMLDFDSDFDFVLPKVDYKVFESAKEILLNQILSVANVPDVSMGKVEISNIAETTMKTLYSRAKDESGINKQVMNKGYTERFEKIRGMLEYKGITFNDDLFYTLEIVYNLAIPESETGIIDNLIKSYQAGVLSLESVLEQHPNCHDVVQEKERILSMKTAN